MRSFNNDKRDDLFYLFNVIIRFNTFYGYLKTNGESDEDSLRWGGLGREEEYDYCDESCDCAEVKKAATKGTAVNLSETGQEE